MPATAGTPGDTIKAPVGVVVDNAGEGRPVTRPPWRDSVAFLYLPYAAVLILTFASSPDDPFITLRYAANIVHGHGVVFNVGGPHVQGFTSPIDLLLAILVYLSPAGHALFKLKLLSVLFGALALREGSTLLYRMARLPIWAKRLGCVAMATSWIVAFSSANGLETSLAMWIDLLLIRRLIVHGSKKPLVTAAVAGAAVLTRPEALLVVALLGAVSLVAERGVALWRRVRWCLGAVAAAGAMLVAGAAYFHELLPNTFYAKSVPFSTAWHVGVEYLTQLQPGVPLKLVFQNALTSQEHSLALVLIVLQVGLAVVGTIFVVRKEPRHAYLLAAVAGQAAFAVSAQGDWMQGGRFLAPAVIPFIILDVAGLVAVTSMLAGRVDHYVSAAAATALLAASVTPLVSQHQPVWSLTGIDDMSLVRSGGYNSFSALWADTALELRVFPAGALVATTEAGFDGFDHLDLRFLDLRGLNDAAIARAAPTQEKSAVGVNEDDWWEPGSVEGRAILAAQPEGIVELSGTQHGDVLDHRYDIFMVTSYGAPLYSQGAVVIVYLRADAVLRVDGTAVRTGHACRELVGLGRTQIICARTVPPATMMLGQGVQG